MNVLYLLKIPALREGNIIHLANTQLFVAEACSGLRSLTALITLGVIFAYFFRKSTAERIIIVLSAIPIAILVNAFRVALTGGPHPPPGPGGGERLDPPDRGALHLRDRLPPAPAGGVAALAAVAQVLARPRKAEDRDMIRLVAAVMFLALNAYVYHFFARTELQPAARELRQLSAWSSRAGCATSARRSPRTSATSSVPATSSCATSGAFRDKPGASVNVYVGYHETQIRKSGGGLSRSAIHLPKHCLPGSGWDVIETGTVELDLPGLPQRPATVNRLVIAKGNQRQLTYYWYQSRGRVIAADYMKMVHLFWDRATKSRTDGSLVRFAVQIDRSDEESAEADLREVASQVVPLLPRYLPE